MVPVHMERTPHLHPWLRWTQTAPTDAIGWAVVMAAVVVEVLRLCDETWWAFALLRHIPLQVAAALAVVLLMGGRRRRKHWWVAWGLLLVQAVRIVPFFTSWSTAHHVVAKTPPPPLKVVTANVLSGNTDLQPLTTWLKEEDPDVVVLVEVSKAQLALLAPALRAYPFVVNHARDWPGGMALLSKTSFADKEVVRVPQSPVALRAVVRVPRPNGNGVSLVEVWGVHPVPPVSSSWTQLRNNALQQLGARVARSPHPVVVAGDFNATPWSAPLQQFAADARLNLAADDLAGATTWPAFVPAPLRIPIDHVFASRSYACARLEVGPEMGSDHLPVVAEFTPVVE